MQGFPAPWRVQKIAGGFLVRDGNKRPVVRVFGQEKPILPDAMTLDQAKEMALTLATLPETLRESEDFHVRGRLIEAGCRAVRSHGLISARFSSRGVVRDGDLELLCLRSNFRCGSA